MAKPIELKIKVTSEGRDKAYELMDKGGHASLAEMLVSAFACYELHLEAQDQDSATSKPLFKRAEGTHSP